MSTLCGPTTVPNGYSNSSLLHRLRVYLVRLLAQKDMVVFLNCEIGVRPRPEGEAALRVEGHIEGFVLIGNSLNDADQYQIVFTGRKA